MHSELTADYVGLVTEMYTRAYMHKYCSIPASCTAMVMFDALSVTMAGSLLIMSHSSNARFNSLHVNPSMAPMHCSRLQNTRNQLPVLISTQPLVL